MLNLICSSLLAGSLSITLAVAGPGAPTFEAVAAGRASALDAESPAAQTAVTEEARAYARYRQKLTPSFRESCERDQASNRFCPFITEPAKPPGEVPTEPPPSTFAIRQIFVNALLSLDEVGARAGNCPAATAQLAEILKDSNAKLLHSRARYWSWVCAGVTKDARAAKRWRDELWAHHPLSILTIESLRHDRDPRLAETLRAPRTPWPLVTRVADDEDLNALLRGIEALLRDREAGAAAVILKRTQGRFDAAEPALRLYVGALAARISALVPNTAPAFRALEPLLTEHREYLRRPTLEALYPRPPEFFDDLLGLRGNLDAGLFAGMIHQESSLYPRSRSRVAFGLTQMRPDTADDVNRVMHLSPKIKFEGGDLFEPKLSLGLGARHLSDLLVKFQNDERLAVAAYHSGDDRLRKWLEAFPKVRDPLILSHVLYLNKEASTSTAVHVINVLGRAAWYRALYGEGLNRE